MVRQTCDVIGIPVDVVDWALALAKVRQWVREGSSRAVFFCNVHSVITARQDHEFARVLQAADMALADGAPIAWMIRRLTHGPQSRISGPDFMDVCCEDAAAQGTPIYLYGATEQTLENLQRRFHSRFQGLRIVGALSPPFRDLTPQEDDAIIESIRASGARIVWVGLGCPRQEQWILDHRGRVPAVMLGVGAAFDFHAGNLQRAPLWARRFGMEWIFRLAHEPRRLWRRYALTNSLFIVAALRQLLARQWASMRGR